MAAAASSASPVSPSPSPSPLSALDLFRAISERQVNISIESVSGFERCPRQPSNKDSLYRVVVLAPESKGMNGTILRLVLNIEGEINGRVVTFHDIPPSWIHLSISL